MSESPLHVAVDPSFLINLFATQLAVELLDIERLFFLVPKRVYDEMKRNRTDLDSLTAQGRAQIVEVPSEAFQHYVDAAAALDDVEAATIATGIGMQVGIATDDGCTIDYWAEKTVASNRRIIGICELLRAAESTIDIQRLREALVRVRRDAKFAPPQHHAEWWKRILNGVR